MWIFLRCRSCNDVQPINQVTPTLVKRFKEGDQLKILKLLLPPKESKVQQTLNNIFEENIKQTILAVFYHPEWERHLQDGCKLRNLGWKQYGDEHRGNTLNTIHVLSRIPTTCIEEVYNVSTWYIPIKDCVKIYSEDTIEKASGDIAKFIIRGTQRIKFHHLIVVNQDNSIIGVITKERIQQAIEATPAPEQAGFVFNYMYPINRILLISHKSSPTNIRAELGSDSTKWSLFRETNSMFLVDEKNTIVGFATDTDLLLKD